MVPKPSMSPEMSDARLSGIPNTTLNISSSWYEDAASAGSVVVAARTLSARTAAQSPSSPTEAMMCAVSTARRTEGGSGHRARVAGRLVVGVVIWSVITRSTVASAARGVVGQSADLGLVPRAPERAEPPPRGRGSLIGG